MKTLAQRIEELLATDPDGRPVSDAGRDLLLEILRRERSRESADQPKAQP